MLVLTKEPALSFYTSPHLDHIPFADGDRSYCKLCDAVRPFYAVRKDWVACSEGHGAHPANLIINGLQRQL